MDVLREYDEEFHIKCEREIALEEGIEQGIEQGTDNMSKLILLLSQNNRQDEILKAARDPLYREKLYEEFNI